MHYEQLKVFASVNSTEQVRPRIPIGINNKQNAWQKITHHNRNQHCTKSPLKVQTFLVEI